MLVLTRKSNQSIMIGDDIEVSVLSVMGDKVRIGIQAPQDIPVFRTEIYLEIHRDQDGAVDGARPASAPTASAPTASAPTASAPTTSAPTASGPAPTTGDGSTEQ
jgi:carbon storage regulator